VGCDLAVLANLLLPLDLALVYVFGALGDSFFLFIVTSILPCPFLPVLILKTDKQVGDRLFDLVLVRFNTLRLLAVDFNLQQSVKIILRKMNHATF
jgi:hypothetical protein